MPPTDIAKLMKIRRGKIIVSQSRDCRRLLCLFASPSLGPPPFSSRLVQPTTCTLSSRTPARMNQTTCRDDAPRSHFSPSPLTEEQWHYLTCLGTARLGDAETPVLMGQALPAEPDPLAPWHMAITWQPDAGRTSPGTLLRPSPAGLSFPFSFPPGISITQGLQEQTRDQAGLPRSPLAR